MQPPEAGPSTADDFKARNMTGSPLASGPEPTDDGSEVSMCQGVEMLDCATLDEFWDLVSPIGEHFREHHSKFIFRGQRDSNGSWFPRYLGRTL